MPRKQERENQGQDEQGLRGTPERLRFTKTTVAAMQCPAMGRRYVYDTVTSGLTICLSSTGKRTWYVYRRVRGRPERLRLGAFPDLTVDQARDIAKAIVGDIAQGLDPVAERRKNRKIPTLKNVFDQWSEIHAKVHRRTYKEDERVFEKYLEPFHGTPIDRITQTAAAAWHGKVGREHGPVMANRAVGLLRTLFNFSPKLGYDGPNPTRGVRRFTENSRDRFLQPREMKAFFAALSKQPQPWRDYIGLLLFTGQRKSSVSSMRWDDLDLDSCLWRIPRPKNDRPTIIPLTPPAVNILAARKMLNPDGCLWVFPSRNGGHLKDARKPWVELLKDAGIDDLHLHDLRRSVGSWQAALGSSLAIIGASLGHADLKSTQIYSRIQVDTVRQSMGGAIEAMLASGKVDPQTLLVNEANEEGM